MCRHNTGSCLELYASYAPENGQVQGQAANVNRKTLTIWRTMAQDHIKNIIKEPGSLEAKI